MHTHLVAQIEDLIRIGMELAPEGGSEFSGYNAKKQSKYLLWRKNCLDALGALNDAGAAFCARITGDENGMYFYHSSAQQIVAVLHEARDAARTAAAEAEERIRAEAKAREEEEARLEAERIAREEAEARERLEAEARERAEAQAREEEALELTRREEAAAQAARDEEARIEARKQIEVLEAKRLQEEREAPSEEAVLAQTRKEADAAADASPLAPPKILIYSLQNHVMLKQLGGFFNEISVDHTIITHTDGSWTQLGGLDDASRYYAVFLLSDRYHGQELMALGYIAGRYPSVQLCCIHAHTLAIGELLPGIAHKVFSVSLDEIKFSLIKDLKTAGCPISI